MKGCYWENGKGCAVGCTIHSGDHSTYEDELGIPTWLAYLEDAVFEGLPNEYAMTWPEKFLEAIPVGVDLEKVKAPFLIFVLESTLDQFDHDKFPDVKSSFDTVIRLYREGETNKNKFEVAAEAAAAAARATWEAAEAVWATWAAEARRAAWAAAAAAEAAEATWAAAAAARAADATWAALAAWGARGDHFRKLADKLLELLKDPMKNLEGA